MLTALIAALIGAAAIARQHWQRSDLTWNPVARLGLTNGRHRLGQVTNPYRPRPWHVIAAEEAANTQVIRRTYIGSHKPYALMQIAGHDDHPLPAELPYDFTGELVLVR